MEDKKYLNEEQYQKTERKLSLVALIILIVGLSIGGLLIFSGVAKPNTSKISDLKAELEAKKSALEAKGIEYNSSAEYTDGEVYDLYIITDVLDPSFDNCGFYKYKNNNLTSEYCSAKNNLNDFSGTPKIMIGSFICITSCMFAGFVFMVAKRRNIAAFTTQQVIPIAKEGIDEMAPTIGNAASEIAKGMKKGFNDNEK